MNESNEAIELDLSVIGIPTTPEMFGIQADDAGLDGCGIRMGDIILCDQIPAKSGDLVAVETGNGTVVRRYLVEDGQHWLQKENEPRIPLEDVTQIQGVAKGLIRKL